MNDLDTNDLKACLQQLADAAVREGQMPGPAAVRRRGRQRRRRLLVGGSLLAAVLVAGVVSVGPLLSLLQAPKPAARPGVPAGWKDVRFHGVVISVPASWKVLNADDVPCGVPPSTGNAVVVGDQTIFPHCPLIIGRRPTVVVLRSSQGPPQGVYTPDYPGPVRPATVNGLRVLVSTGPLKEKTVAPHSDTIKPGLVTWATATVAVFPDQHVLLAITDPSQGAIGSQILQTARRG